ncbi:hypothetical protein MMC24_002882 [Lignoscripta atroalba]|nr:hypothetical protein [Lignoscripta atroalba]
MVQPWIFTSPASRGVGLQLTRRLLATTKLPIVATARTDPEGTKDRILDGLDVDKQRLEVLKLDVTDESTVSEAAAYCKDRFSSSYLHLAFCVPGILYPEKSPSQISYPDALQTFKINTLGPLLLMKHFSPFLPRKSTTLAPSSDLSGLPVSAVFAMMSARVGSITDNSKGGWFSYRSSKAAVNQITKSFDIYLRNSAGEKAMAVSLHPGTVKTDLSEEFWESTPKEKLFSPEFSAERLVEVVKALGVEGRGKCWDWEGKEIPP